MSKNPDDINKLINQTFEYTFSNFKNKLRNLYSMNPASVYNIIDSMTDFLFFTFDITKGGSIGELIKRKIEEHPALPLTGLEDAFSELVSNGVFTDKSSAEVKKLTKLSLFDNVTGKLNPSGKVIEYNELITEDSSISCPIYPRFIYDAFPDSQRNFKVLKDAKLIDAYIDKIEDVYKFICSSSTRAILFNYVLKKAMNGCLRNDEFSVLKYRAESSINGIIDCSGLDGKLERARNIASLTNPDSITENILSMIDDQARSFTLIDESDIKSYEKMSGSSDTIDKIKDYISIVNGYDIVKSIHYLKSKILNGEEINAKEISSLKKLKDKKLIAKVNDYVNLLNAILELPEDFLRQEIGKINRLLSETDPLSQVKNEWNDIEKIVINHETDAPCNYESLVSDLETSLGNRYSLSKSCLIDGFTCSILTNGKETILDLDKDSNGDLSESARLQVYKELQKIYFLDKKKYSQLSEFKIASKISGIELNEFNELIAGVNKYSKKTGLNVSCLIKPSSVLSSIINVHNYYKLKDVNNKEYSVLSGKKIRESIMPHYLREKLINGSELLPIEQVYSLVKKEAIRASRFSAVNNYDVVECYIKKFGWLNNSLSRVCLNRKGLI